MATWTEFYVNTSDVVALTGQLMSITGIAAATKGKMPDDYHASYMSDEGAMPTYLLIGKMSDDWVVVRHNSFNKLEPWGVLLSKRFNCKVIFTMAQSVSDAYYFASYDGGRKTREIEVCHSDDSEHLNYGPPFEFEGEEPGNKEEFDGRVEYVFDFDSIKAYCKHFDLDIEADERGSMEWTVLKGGLKPWWKLW